MFSRSSGAYRSSSSLSRGEEVARGLPFGEGGVDGCSVGWKSGSVMSSSGSALVLGVPVDDMEVVVPALSRGCFIPALAFLVSAAS